MKYLIGRLIDGTGSEIKKDIFMTTEKGHISGMRPFFRGDAVPGESWCDLSDCTVLPPLIDAHVHLAISADSERDRTNDSRTTAYESIKPSISRYIRDCMAYGVMGVRDGGDSKGIVLRYKNGELKAKKNRFRLNAAGCAWHRENRYGKLIGRAIPVGEDPLTAVTDGSGSNPDHIKLIQSGLNSLNEFGRQTPPQFGEETIERIYAYSRARRVGLMVHANGHLPVAAAVSGGCDSIEHGYFMGNENLRKMADAGIAWVPTITPMKAYVDHSPKDSIAYDVARRTLDHQRGQLSKAKKYGVTVAVGTDAGSPGVAHGRAVWEELKLFETAGYTTAEAVSCATLNAAQLMKTDMDGFLAVGMPATFIAVKGTSSDVLTFGGIEMTVVQGKVVEGRGHRAEGKEEKSG
jgi:imidazolonepropionase-like amidohydrolase